MSEPTDSFRVRVALTDDRLAATLLAHCRWMDEATAPTAIDTEIHPDCQMLGHSLRVHDDVNRAVSQYFSVAMQQYQVVRQLIQRLFDEPAEIDFLDFACGFGRLLRFLVHSLPREHLYASEIQTEALAWVDERYGVQTLPSGPDPADFAPGRHFDMIWVASLFSHLPDALFRRWLSRLAESLSPGGVLCFSVHDEALLPPDMAVGDNGVLYIAGSENDGLDPAIYGTTFVTADYVQSVITQTMGEHARVRRLPRLLAHEQDVYVVTSAHGPDLSPLAEFQRGTRGWLDELEVDQAAGTLWLKGWAGSLDEIGLAHVEVRLNDRVIQHKANEPTPRVAEVLGRPELARSGFSLSLPLPPGTDPWLALSAVAEDGERALIYAGRLGPA